MERIELIDIKVTIDTIILVAKLDSESKEFINDRFIMNGSSEFFRNSIVSKKPFFVINLNPRNKFAKRHYNAMIIIQHETLMNMPASLTEIIAKFDWKFKRIDIAFDSKCKFDKHAFIKHHGNVKTYKGTGWRGYYIGSKQSKTKLNIYDRNKKEQDRGNAVHHEYGTRFEVRIRPKLTDAKTIHNIDSEMLAKELAKYIVIEDASLLDTSQWNINRLHNLKDNLTNKDDYKNRWDRYGKTIQQELKAIAKQNKIPFEDLFTEQVDSLFQWTHYDTHN